MKKTPKEYRKASIYTVIFAIIPMVILIVLLSATDFIASFFINAISDSDISYAYFNLSVPLIAFWIFTLISILICGYLFLALPKSKSSLFDEYSSHSAKKHKAAITALIISLCLCFLCFVPMTQCRYTADEQGYKYSYFLRDEEIVFDYESVVSAEIFVDCISGYRTVDYEICIQIHANEETYTLFHEGFGYDYKNTLKFLNNIDKDKITLNSTDIEKVDVPNEKQKYYLDKILNEYS